MTKPTMTMSLRRIVRLLSSRSLRLGGFFRGAAEAALQVVEDKAHGGGGPGRRRDSPAAVPHDEDAAVVGRSLELSDVRGVAREVVDRREQVGSRCRKGAGCLVVAEGRALNRTALVEEH